MCSYWRSLLRGLLACAANPTVERAFARWRTSSSRLDAVATAWSAIALMRDPDIAPDRKTPILHELVTIVRTHDRKDATLAWTIILIALWPGLDAMYRRHRRTDDEPDLGPLIVGQVATVLARSAAALDPNADLPKTAVIRLAIEHLPGEDTKELLELVASGRPAREISGILDCSEAAIWKRLERVRATMATLYAPRTVRTGQAD